MSDLSSVPVASNAAELLATMRAAAALAPEDRPSDPFEFAATARAHVVRVGDSILDYGMPSFYQRADPDPETGAYRAGEWIKPAGPVMPEWRAPTDARISFAYRVKGITGRLTCENYRAAILRLVDRFDTGAGRAALDGKTRKAPVPWKAPAASALHVAARAALADREFANALALAESASPVYFGAGASLHMHTECIDVHGASFTVARFVSSGLFVVLDAIAGLRIDPRPKAGFTTTAAAIAWIEAKMTEGAFAERVHAAMRTAAPCDQSAMRAKFLRGADDPAAPEASGPETPADAPETPATAPTTPQTRESSGETFAAILAPSIAPAAPSLDPSLVRSAWNAGDDDAGRPLAPREDYRAHDGPEDPPTETAPERPETTLATPIAAPDVPTAPETVASAPIADAAPDPAVSVRHVSAAEWQAATGERTAGDSAVAAAARAVAGLCEGFPVPARLRVAIDTGLTGDPAARRMLHKTLAGIAAASHLPQSAPALAALAALDAAPARRKRAGKAPPTTQSDTRPPATHSQTPAPAVPSVAAKPPDTHSEPIDGLHTHERPCAAPGLTSYRARGVFGWIMIGASDDADAMREALRSTGRAPTNLQVWDGAQYVPCTPQPPTGQSEAWSVRASFAAGFAYVSSIAFAHGDGELTARQIAERYPLADPDAFANGMRDAISGDRYRIDLHAITPTKTPATHSAPPTVQPAPVAPPVDRVSAAFTRIAARATTARELIAEANRVAANAETMARLKQPIAHEFAALAARLTVAALAMPAA